MPWPWPTAAPSIDFSRAGIGDIHSSGGCGSGAMSENSADITEARKGGAYQRRGVGCGGVI